MPSLFDHRAGNIDTHDFLVVVPERDSKTPDSAAEIQRARAPSLRQKAIGLFHEMCDMTFPCFQKRGLIPFGPAHGRSENRRVCIAAPMRFPLTPQPAN